MSVSILRQGPVPTDRSEWEDFYGNRYRRQFGHVFGCSGARWYTQYSYTPDTKFHTGEGCGQRALRCTKKTTRKERSEIKKNYLDKHPELR